MRAPHFHPILLSHVNHSGRDSEDRVQWDHYGVAVVHVHSDSVHPIQLDHFDYDDNALVLADLTDNTPKYEVENLV